MRRRRPVEPECLSPDDVWFANCDREVAKAMVAKMKDWNCKRPIYSMTELELKTLARVAVDTWLTLQSRRSAEQPPYPKVEITL
jgi:hypothetical protein